MIVELRAKQTYGSPAKPSNAAKAHSAATNHFEKSKTDTVDLSGKKNSPSKVVNTIDMVNLSVGLSIDEVNRMMVSEVGKRVNAMFEEAGIEPTDIANTDWSSDATATRIFEGTTNMFEIWRSQNKDMEEAELIDSFEEVLRKSVDMGASEAIGLIEGRGFDDEVVGTAQETMSLVHSKFDEYFGNLRSALEQEDSPQQE